MEEEEEEEAVYPISYLYNAPTEYAKAGPLSIYVLCFFSVSRVLA